MDTMTDSISLFVLFVLGNCIALMMALFLARLVFGASGKTNRPRTADTEKAINSDDVIDVEFETVEASQQRSDPFLARRSQSGKNSHSTSRSKTTAARARASWARNLKILRSAP